MKRSTFIIALIAVLFAACSNLLQPPVKPAALNPTESPAPGMGRLAIRIAPPQAERTLLPDEPVFTRYELHLYYSTAGGASKIIEIAEDNTEVELREGSWRVEVKAFVMFKGAETQAASGSTSITVVNGTTATAAVELKLSQYNESVLRYTVNWEGVNPDTALLRVFGYRSSMADFYPAPDYAVSLMGAGANTGSMTIRTFSGNGSFMVQVTLGKGAQKAVKSDVFHAYDALETAADFSFSAADFTGTAMLAGRLEMQPQADWTISGGTVEAYSAGDYAPASLIGTASVTGADWTMSIPAEDMPLSMTLYLTAQANASGSGGPQTFTAKKTVALSAMAKGDIVIPFADTMWTEATIGGLGAYLAALPENNAKTPYYVAVSGIDISVSANLQSIYEGLTRYVDLDLSACTGASYPKVVHEGRGNIVSLTMPNSVTSLAAEAFMDCPTLAAVNMPQITSINDYAFAVCKSLVTVNMPSAVSIGHYAFAQCTALVEMDMPNVTSIGASAFLGCSLLQSVHIPKVTAIYANGFNGCYSLLSITAPELGYAREYTFYNCSSLLFADMPKLTGTGGGMFYGCSSLVSVNIPKVTAIRTEGGRTLYPSFAHCTALKSIDAPELLTIEARSFYKCTSLESVNMPKVTTIHGGAFFGCTSLAFIDLPDTLQSINEHEGALDWVQTGIFYGCTSLVSVTIPDSITSIGTSAFSGCTSLASVTIPDSVTTIGQAAFQGCTSLTSVTLGDSLTTIGAVAFGGCTSLSSVTLGNSLTAIGAGVFGNCSLTSITIPDSVTSIGSEAFYGCSLTSITIPDSVTTISDGAFGNCPISSVTIPDSVTYLAGFNGCPLTSITIPDSVTTIGGDAFYGCPLTSITIPDSVTIIGGRAFSNCPLTSITIPDSVTSIGGGAFYGCSSLTSITIPDSVTTIGDAAFRSCTSLTSIDIPDSVTTLGPYVFFGCTSLTSITIPDSVTAIPHSAFGGGCTALASVTLGDSITAIGNSAFNYCTALTLVICKAATPPILNLSYNQDPFEGTYSIAFKVPAASVEAYKTAPIWERYAAKISAITE